MQHEIAAKVRAEGEVRAIQWNPSFHPGVIKRFLLLGHGRDDVAAALGISPSTLARWFAAHEELDECAFEEKIVNANLFSSAYRAAVGEYNAATGEYEGGDGYLALRLLERRDPDFSPKAMQLEAERRHAERTAEGSGTERERLESALAKVQAVEEGRTGSRSAVRAIERAGVPGSGEGPT